MAVKYAVLLLNICILFNIGNCGASFKPRFKKYDAFDWRLFRTISNSNNKNTITSPFSIKVLLTIAREAASGITRNEIQNALTDLPKELNGLSWFQDVIRSLEKKSALYELIYASKVFLDERLTPNKSFIETSKGYFNAKTQTLNFGDAQQSAKIINDWSSTNTKGIIKELVTEDQIRSAVAVLTNAIYFKGMWERGFQKSFTTKMPFRKNNGEVVEASMMSKEGQAFYVETSKLGDGAKLLRLPYKGGEFAITFILPKEDNGLDKVIASIKPGLIGQLQKDMEEVFVDISLPKFEFKSNLKLKNSLQALNIKQIFSNDAKLPGFGLLKVAVTDIIQKAGIKVDEEGTEAAAASAGIMIPISFTVTSLTFKADHPFAFFIEHEASGALLFAGKVLDPTAK